MLKPPLKPMLLSTLKKPFNSDDYLFEIKWDGYRCILFIDNHKSYLQSRNQKKLNPFFPELKNISRNIAAKQAILDGEICYLNKEGKPVFKHLMGRISNKDTIIEKIKNPVSLIVWDLLSVNNKDIYQLPLIDRKKKLQAIIKENTQQLLLSSYLLKEGKKLFKAIKNEKLEGIVAKKIDSPYEFKRSKYWFKIKVWQYTEAIIGGYSKDHSSLLVGKLQEKKLVYMGKVKISLTIKEKTTLFQFLPSIKNKHSPFINKKTSKNYWVTPAIKCEIRYTEISHKNTFRHGYCTKLIFK